MSSILKDLFCAPKQAKKANYAGNDFYGKRLKNDFRNDKLYFKNLTKPIQFSCQLLT